MQNVPVCGLLIVCASGKRHVAKFNVTIVVTPISTWSSLSVGCCARLSSAVQRKCQQQQCLQRITSVTVQSHSYFVRRRVARAVLCTTDEQQLGMHSAANALLSAMLRVAADVECVTIMTAHVTMQASSKKYLQAQSRVYT
jgi:hypothetical protein